MKKQSGYLDTKMHEIKKIGELLLYLFFVFLITGCKKFPVAEQEVYRNDFEQGDITGIRNAKINSFNNSKVLGFYNDDSLDLSLDNLPKHDLVRITFDLYIHDSWDGNNTVNGTVIDGPDLWQMKLDGDTYINTTFSNVFCDEVYCLVQSYPRNYPYRNKSAEGAFSRDLPGVCWLKNTKGGTSLYKIERSIRHKKNSLFLEFKDMLKQNNTPNPLCDESWSMDNISITTFVLK